MKIGQKETEDASIKDVPGCQGSYEPKDRPDPQRSVLQLHRPRIHTVTGFQHALIQEALERVSILRSPRGGGLDLDPHCARATGPISYLSWWPERGESNSGIRLFGL